MKTLVREISIDFCTEFLRDPYLCYTEHGQHALFFSMLFNQLPENRRYTLWNGNRVCVIQKEYPTADRLGKPTRQHWDIAVLKSPPYSISDSSNSYDYLSIEVAIEFGLNEDLEHLEDDIDRISHPNSNVDYGYLIHLYRFSTPGSPVSGRDWSPKSKRIASRKQVSDLVVGKNLQVLYGLTDSTNTHETGLWLIQPDLNIQKIFPPAT